MKARSLLPLVALAGFGGAFGSSPRLFAEAPAAKASSSATKSGEPGEIEIIDLNPEPPRDPQRIALGGQLGAMWMTARGAGKGTGAIDFALLGSFGLGPGGARVPFTLDVWIGAAIAYGAFNLEPSQEQAPNRFTEIGTRLVYHREPSGGFSWMSIGGGLAWTSTRPNSDPNFDPRCNDANAAAAAGVHCPIRGDIAPGALVEAGFGVFEWLSRNARTGVGLRFPGQLSRYPGIGAVLFLYGQIGLQR